MAITASRTNFTADGKSVGGYLARPAGVTQAPAIIVIQEWWGLNQHIEDITRRLAEAGYIAAAVDLYHGVTTTDPQEAGKLMSSLNPQQALADIATALSFLRNDSSVSAVGITGFCMGGVYSLLAACNFELEAAAPFYGMPDDLSVIKNLRCPLLFIGGEKDQWITVEKMNKLSEALQQYGKSEAEVKIYAGADHAFFNDTRPDVYNAAAAADAWRRVLDFFSKHLRKGQAAGA
jgi:carboxymethylenebutenolidase